MSSPTRQVANRRLPPLAGSKSSANARNREHLNPPGSTKSPVGYRGTDLQLNLADGPFRPALVTAKPLNERSYNGKQQPKEIDAESVRTFLQLSPQFLDDFVLKNVDQQRLERWLIRKARKDKKNLTSSQSVDSGSQEGESHRPSLSKWKFCVHADKKKMLEELTNDIHHLPNKEKVLAELVNCIASACHADGYSLYIVDISGKELYQNNPSQPGSRTSLTLQIKENSTVAGYVAVTSKPVRVIDILEDARFPDGIGIEGSTAQSVLCQPIVQSNGELVGVVELTRTLGNEPFGEEDEEIVNSYLVWGGIALYYSEMYHSMHRHRKLSEFLLNVTRSIFQDIISMDTVIMKIMNYAQTLVDADRTSLFLVDSRTNELYARIFDVGGRMADSTSLKKEIRFPKSKGVAGYVATTGETLNILDAYHDGRFNREIDLQTGYTTKTLLCMPIFIRGNIIGVVQMVNKKSGVFTKADEQSFQTFAIYCGLALHHAKLYDKIRRSEQKYKVALEVLSYHSMCNEQEIRTLKDLLESHETTYPGIDEYEFNPYDVEWEVLPRLVIEMFANLFSMQKCRSLNGDQMKTVPTSRLTDSLNSRFDVDELIKFTLTVRKNYRRVPYHNWTHAFNVAHCMYNVIQKSNGQFNSLESLALYVACICHDLDHRGRTNSWMKMEGTPLAAVYTTSTMEHHHFNQTITILQHEGHNIFSHLSSVEYKAVLGFIKDCILATDLALFFGNKSKLKDLLDTNKFNWDTLEHRKLVHAISMTACDLSACTKPWNIQYETVKVIFQEFYAEGDEQKAQGRQPIPMMDRDTAHELPAHQVGFLVGICLPCYELLWRCLPGTKPLLDGAKANLQHWSELVAKQKKELQNKESAAQETQEKNEEKKDNETKKEEKEAEKVDQEKSDK